MPTGLPDVGRQANLPAMPIDLQVLLARLQADCTAAEQAEQAVRAEVEARLEQAQRARAFAWRRYHVLKGMEQAAARQPERSAAVEQQLVELFREIGWIDSSLDELGVGGVPLIERLRPIAETLHAAHHLDTAAGAEAEALAVADPLDAFLVFEAWFESERGQPFLHVFERYMPPTPVIEF